MPKRQYNIDILRIFACFMVLILHVAGHNWGKTEPESFAWQVFNVYDILVRSAVPLFFMISGKLFLARDEISVKRLFSKNILKLVLVYFFWSLLYAVDSMGIRELIASRDISRLFTTTVAGKYHLWYLPALVSVYLLIPVFIAMKGYKGGRILDYAAAIFFIFGILRYSVLLLPLDQRVKDILLKFNFTFDSYCGYFLMGHILDKYKEKMKKIPSVVLMLIFVLTAAVTALASSYLSLKAGEGVSTLYNNFFISTFLEASAIFLLFLRIPAFEVKRPLGKIIEKVSSYTFFVYLFHPYVIEHLDLWLGFDSLSFNPALSVPTIALLLMVICMTIAFVLDRIPVIKKLFI